MPVIVVLAQSPILVIHHADGKTTEVELNTMPCITMTADKMQIKSSVAELVYDKSDVLKFTFKNVITGMSTIQNRMAYRIDEDEITFHGIPKTCEVRVYNGKGLQIPVCLMTRGTDAVLSLAQFPKGIYLIYINGITMKFLRP